MTTNIPSTLSISKPTNTITTGLLGIILVLTISALCIFPFELQFFVQWVTMAFMAATPAQIILGLLWENKTPHFINKYPAPVKGLILTLITIFAAIVVFKSLLVFISGGHGITPMLSQYTIMTINLTLFIILIWECWPFSKVSANPKVIGLLTLVAVYPISYALWSVFFDYGNLAAINSPVYFTDIDPNGLFDMWQSIAFAVTVTAAVIVHILFDFWPITKLCGITKNSKLAKQPVKGLISTGYLLVLSWLIYYLFVTVLNMDQVDFMVRVPVCMIFGTLLVHNMMQDGLFIHLKQPVRGIMLLLCCVVATVVMHKLYVLASTMHAGYELGTGAKGGYAQEIWIASAMLGVTFPVIFVVSGFFDFWPIKRNKYE